VGGKEEEGRRKVFKISLQDCISTEKTHFPELIPLHPMAKHGKRARHIVSDRKLGRKKKKKTFVESQEREWKRDKRKKGCVL